MPAFHVSYVSVQLRELGIRFMLASSTAACFPSFRSASLADSLAGPALMSSSLSLAVVALKR